MAVSRRSDNRRKVICIATVRDPHHDARCEWGITDERRLYHRPWDGGPWQKVNRVSFTPPRILVLAWLVEEAERLIAAREGAREE